ncbi:MAG: AbrB family transcriptional regulator [Oscillibacter sp.]|jgi:membrane AbrB-like protein|nr:AbrB family transcriptional regulator [Oscillibacter sp.]
MVQTALTLALCTAAGLLFYRKRIPAGMLIGAVAASAVLTAGFQMGTVPSGFKHIAQVVAGVFIGCSAGRDDFRQLKTFGRPVLMITASLLLVNVAVGGLLFLSGYSDLLTCLVCAVPGGISDVTLIAVDFGTDASKVLLVHFCRLVVGVAVFPTVVQRITPPMPEGTGESAARKGGKPDRRGTARLLLALAVSSAGAWLGNRLDIPAASILVPLFITFALNLSGFSIPFPSWLRQAAQVVSGAYIGGLLDPGRFGNPITVLSAVVITIAVLLANAYLFSRWMERRFQVPLREGMLMLTPAGAGDMALISADIGVSSPRLILVQIYRLLIATAVFPHLCLLLVRALGV